MWGVLISAYHEPFRRASGGFGKTRWHAWEERFMTIRGLASELYRAMRRVEELKRKLQDNSTPEVDKAELAEQLRQARAERDRMQAMLEGAKDR